MRGVLAGGRYDPRRGKEKVLELQDTKRNWAAAIIGADNIMIRDLRSEDLALLLF